MSASSRDIHRTDATSVRPIRRLVSLQLDAEGFVEILHRTRDDYAAPADAFSYHRQIVCLGEFAKLDEVFGIGAVKAVEFIVR
jgi:hypothetical protein